jgi:hypothetical protein
MLRRAVRNSGAPLLRSHACRRAISSSVPRFLESKQATEEQTQMIDNELDLSPRVQHALTLICELNLIEIAELSKAIQVLCIHIVINGYRYVVTDQFLCW